MEREPARYRFGPLEPGGALGGLTWAQVACIAGGLLGLVLSLNAAPGPAGALIGLAMAAAGAAAALGSLGGRAPIAWGTTAGGFAARRVTGRLRYRSASPGRGHPLGGTPLPETLSDVRILSAPTAGGEVGVVRDGPTWTAVIAVEPGAFALLDLADKERRVARWGSVLAGFATPASPVSRLQWIERTAAEPPDALGRHLREGLGLDPADPAVHSYLELIADAGAPARRHETFLCLQVDGRRAARAVRRAGGGDAGGCAVLLRELAGLAERLRGAEVPVRGLLSPGQVARAIRLGFDPDARSALDAHPADGAGREGVSPSAAGPMAADEAWRSYRTDGAIHATYWIAEWPRVDVGADFLMPLILTTTAWRTVAVTIEALDPARAIRQAENARTGATSDEELRARLGFSATARRRRRQEALLDEEDETASGHAGCRFSGYVTVSARSAEELEGALADVEHQAQGSRLELRPMWGEQAIAFTYTLPLCRGLR
ncbi:SCO6880 family protein [Miltoncostaea marina]|uniref:SCO6880 family protein n=1 Tax=Miltoncostaea marina TaxID=2843215 RepID=UPI001C3C34A6|nr:SCO6880 family protein [Miltoncostaea marina]